jgi:oxygen-independent coproporphyrinogen III oxidase
MMTNKPKALYVHVPFCDVICAYCDFTRVVSHPKLIEDYLYALAQEIKLYPDIQYETIYLGGGTPSALNMDQLTTLFEILKEHSLNVKEYTIEVNPESLSFEKAELMLKYGINRVSFGVQSFNQDELVFMHRAHTINMIREGIHILRKAGINNISIDLIYALPNQTLDKWEYNLNQALTLDIDHISLYALTIEENAEFGRMKIKPIESEIEEQMYFTAIEFLAKHGFNRYEISNFTQSKPSMHNLHYWSYDDYIGLGPGAVSLYQHKRIENTKNLLYYSQFKFHGQIIDLSQDDEMFEFVMMGLRVKAGIKLSRFKERYNLELTDVFKSAIQKGIDHKWLEIINDTLRCTEDGYGLLHEVLVEFMS